MTNETIAGREPRGRRAPFGAAATIALALIAGIGWGPVRGASPGATTSATSSDPRWRALQDAHWIQDGQKTAPRIVYMFTDPNCPYCNKLWTDSRPWVDAGRVEIRHVMVAILTPTSATKAAALLDARDSTRALNDYETRARAATTSMLASGHVHPLGDDGAPASSAIPAATKATLAANLRLMQSLGLEATPAVAWLDDSKGLQVQQGVSPQDESRIFGLR